jgi:hypothetical protein
VTEEDIVLFNMIKTISSKRPEVIGLIINAVTAGVQDAIKSARSDQFEWECIASSAVNIRVLKDTKASIASRLETLSPRACLNWKNTLERLKK